MSSFAPPSKKARRSSSNGSSADSDGEFFPGGLQSSFLYLHVYNFRARITVFLLHVGIGCGVCV